MTVESRTFFWPGSADLDEIITTLRYILSQGTFTIGTVDIISMTSFPLLFASTNLCYNLHVSLSALDLMSCFVEKAEDVRWEYQSLATTTPNLKTPSAILSCSPRLCWSKTNATTCCCLTGLSLLYSCPPFTKESHQHLVMFVSSSLNGELSFHFLCPSPQ